MIGYKIAKNITKKITKYFRGTWKWDRNIKMPAEERHQIIDKLRLIIYNIMEYKKIISLLDNTQTHLNLKHQNISTKQKVGLK